MWLLMEEDSGQQVNREKHCGKGVLEQFTKKSIEERENAKSSK